MKHEVVAAMIIQSHRILLGRRSASRDFYPDVWDAFGGHMEQGETQAQTLSRELQEELGIVPTQWIYLDTKTIPLSPDGDQDPLVLHLYLVTLWTGTPENRQPEEHSTIGWFTLEEAVQLPLADPGYTRFFARYLGPDSKP